jgi:glycosyltransferase involved in cell wall biosynthesis
MKLAIVRGKFLNQYEMQSFVPLVKRYDITAFGSLHPYHDTFPFPVKKLISPMDLPRFPWKMPILNRMFIDAQYLVGLEEKLKGFDIVHTAETYYRYTQQALNAKKKGYVKKVVATVLENIPFNNEGILGRKAYKKRAREELDHIIALTHKTKTALLAEGADPKKITVIGHGIDTKRFAPSRDHWKRLGSQDHTITILFSGRLEQYKGVFDCLDAALILLRDRSIKQQLKLIFAGDGNAYSAMRRKEKEYGIERFAEHTFVPYDQMPEIYRNADIVVAPSKSTKTWSEQYCTALLEAQSMGLPIVTTKNGGIPENVGNAALFCNEGDSRSLSEQMKRFIQNPSLRVQYGRMGRERAIHVHDINIIAHKLDRVYQSTMETCDHNV